MSSPERLYRLGVDHLTGDEQLRELANPSPKTQELRRRRYEEYLESLNPPPTKKPAEGGGPKLRQQNDKPLDPARRQSRLNGWERLAVVLSVLWCVCVLIATWDNRIGSHYSILGISVRWNRLVMVSIALAPVLPWIAFISVRWVAQGFRESSRSRMATAGQVQASAPLVVATPRPAATNSTSNVAVADGKTGTLRAWVVSLGVLLVLAYAGLFIPAFAGHRPMPQDGSASTTSTALFFYLLWRLRNKRGWHGALIGACAGLVAFFCAGFISGYVSRL